MSLKTTAVLRLLSLATRATDLRPRDSVAYIDARTSCNDARAALSLALGHPVSAVDPVDGVAPVNL